MIEGLDMPAVAAAAVVSDSGSDLPATCCLDVMHVPCDSANPWGLAD